MVLKINKAGLSLWILLSEHLQYSLFFLFMCRQMVGCCLQGGHKAVEALAGQQGNIFGLPGHGYFSGFVQHVDNPLLDKDSRQENQQQGHHDGEHHFFAAIQESPPPLPTSPCVGAIGHPGLIHQRDSATGPAGHRFHRQRRNGRQAFVP